MGNNSMTRYAYDPKTFRVLRQRSALYAHSGHTYTPHGGTQQDLQYTYDLEGTITTTNDAAPANASTQGPGNLLRRFAHDPLRRLLSATGRESSNVYQQPSWDLNLRPQDYTATNTYTRSYQYDKLGNIQKLKHKAAGHTNQDFDREYSYEITHNKLVGFTVNSTLFENKYDANGNLVKEGQSRFYEWTANDKMAVFKNQAGGSTPSVYTNYFYNAQGERIKKHTRKGNKVIVTFYMDGGLFETSYVKPTGGSIDNHRFYNTLHILDGSSRMATLRVGNNVDDHTPVIKYIVGDPLNNSTAVLTASGSLINREEYYPFGETSFGGFQYKRYRYNGKEKDEESGLYEYGQRYYAPWVCRFVSVDPVAAKFADLSPYNYAGNRPITKVDIDGLQEEDRQGTPSGRAHIQNLPAKKGGDVKIINIPVHGTSKPELTLIGSKGGGEVNNGVSDSAALSQLQPSQVDNTAVVNNIKLPQITGNGEWLPVENGLPTKHLKPVTITANTPEGVNTGKQGESISQEISDIWNSPLSRYFVPDFVSVGAGFNSIFGIGSATSIEFNWVLRGPEASIKPALTVSQSVGGGYSVDATINIGFTNYLGNVKDIRRGMLQTSIANGGLTYWGSVGLTAGGKVGLTGTYTPTAKGYGLVGRELNIGLGLPAGELPLNAAVGVRNTFILKDFEK